MIYNHTQTRYGVGEAVKTLQSQQRYRAGFGKPGLDLGLCPRLGHSLGLGLGRRRLHRES